MRSFESIDNHRLIFNGLEHIDFELGRQSTSYFRVAREAHQILYRSLVDTLKGTANIAVIGKRKGQRQHWYQRDGPIKEIHKESVPECNFAWRFSNPTVVESFPKIEPIEAPSRSDDFLIPFYDALAMVQTECFVHQFVHSQAVTLSNEEIQLMEWLHEAIRNEYEHFVPKGYSAPIHDLLLASKVAVSKARVSLFDTNNVLFFDHSVPEEIMREKFDSTFGSIDARATSSGNALKDSQ